MILLLLQLAHAGVPLVYDGELPDDVVANAAKRTGLPTTQFDPIPLDTILKIPPRTLGKAVLRHCSGTLTRTVELRTNALRAETSWENGSPAEAMDQLDLGIAGLGCLSERVENPVAGRLFLLRGALIARSGDAEGARSEFRTALSLGVAPTWPEGFPAEGQPLFEEVTRETSSANLSMMPVFTGASPIIDGITVNMAEVQKLRPGLHLLQVPSTAGLRSAWLTVDGEATLVIPGNYRRPVLEQMSDAAGRMTVESLLVSTLGGEGVYISNKGGLWLLTAEDGIPHTTTLVAPPPPPPPSTKKRP